MCAQQLYDHRMDKMDDIVADWIRTARISAELSQDDLGARLQLLMPDKKGNTKGNISCLERGEHLPSLRLLIAISKITKAQLPSALLHFFEPERVAIDDGKVSPEAAQVAFAFDRLEPQQQLPIVATLRAFGVLKNLPAPDSEDPELSRFLVGSMSQRPKDEQKEKKLSRRTGS